MIMGMKINTRAPFWTNQQHPNLHIAKKYADWYSCGVTSLQPTYDMISVNDIGSHVIQFYHEPAQFVCSNMKILSNL